MKEEDLLAAVHAQPDDDAPRLAHADWLEANGDPERAELIRLQIAWTLAPADARPGGPRITALLARRERWLTGRPLGSGIRWNFRRGYPEEVVIWNDERFAEWCACAERFPVRRLNLLRIPSVAALADCTALGVLSDLSLSATVLGDAEAAAVLRSPHLAALTRLSIVTSTVTGATLTLIAGLPRLAALREMSVGTHAEDPLRREEVEAFASSPLMGRLDILKLLGWEVAPGALRPLWRAAGPLRRLALTRARLGPEQLDGAGEGLPALEALDLAHNRLGDDGAEAAARAGWPRLRGLHLETNLIGERGVRALAALGGLEVLALGGNAIADDGAEVIARAPALASLRSLFLSRNLIGDAGAAALGRSTSLAGLRSLSLSGNPARREPTLAVMARFRDGLPPIEGATLAAPAFAAPPPVGRGDEDALVRAVLADPWDDLAHGAYADWLEEQGAALNAELIRPPGPDGPRVAEILERLAGDLPMWCAGLGVGRGILFARVDAAAFATEELAREAPAWLRTRHVIEVRPVGEAGDWGAVGACPVLAGLWGLSGIHGEAAAALAQDEGLRRLASLGLRGARAGRRGLSALASCPHLAGLWRLDLSHTRPTVNGLRELADGPAAAGLRLLGLASSMATGGGLVLLFPAIEGLVSLDLDANPLGDQGAAALAGSPWAGTLRSLSLAGTRLTDAGAAVLARSPLMAGLHWLSVANNRVCAAGVLALARAAAPGCRLVVPGGLPEACLAEARSLLGARLIIAAEAS